MSEELSYFWNGVTTGDAREAPYSSDVYKMIYNILLNSDRTRQGVLHAIGSELIVTNPASLTIRVTPGAALVDGRFYENDSNLDFVVTQPSIAPRWDRIVLRVDYQGQTIRAVIKTGAEGGSVRSLLQNEQYWEIPLAACKVGTGGVIRITDERTFAVSRLTDVPTTSGAWTLLDSAESTGTERWLQFPGPWNAYHHLLVLGGVRFDPGGERAESGLSRLDFQFNSDSDFNYGWHWGSSFDPTTGAQSFTQGQVSSWSTYGSLRSVVSDSAVADLFSPVYLLIHNPNDLTVFKQFMGISGSMGGTHADPSDMSLSFGVWRSTSRLRRIRFFNADYPVTGSFGALSKLYLLGIKG